MYGDLARLIHSAVLQNDLPAKELAERIGKPYSTLLREVNPQDQGAKLGVETFVEILKVTGDMAPMHHIADQLGLDLVIKNEKRCV